MIDLHAHTTVSDGTFTPRELIQTAKKAGLSAVAITDHDSIDGHNEAQAEADRLGIQLIKGIEFTVVYDDTRMLHILGLGIDTTNKTFQEIYSEFRRERSEKLPVVFKELRAMGIEVTYEDVEPFILGGYMDRQAICKYLVAEGYAATMAHAWIDHLDYIDYRPGELITPQKAFRAIHSAGGKAFLAHFHMPIGLKGYSDGETLRRLKELKEMGLDGMEYYYPTFSEEDTIRCARYVEELDFLICGGTDFHGANRPHIKLGIGEGDFRVPDDILDNILLTPITQSSKK